MHASNEVAMERQAISSEGKHLQRAGRCGVRRLAATAFESRPIRRTGVASAADMSRPHAIAALTSHQQLVSAGTRNSRTGVASAAGVCRPHAVAALTSHQQLVSARQSNATANEPPH